MPDLPEIRETFSFFDTWEDRYKFIIDMGKSLSRLQDDQYRDENLVKGCQSQVWLVISFDTNTKRLTFQLDSDAHIVRGLIAIVLAAYNGKTPDEVIQFDIESLFEELDLISHLSMTRGNGLRAMVQRIRTEASHFAD